MTAGGLRKLKKGAIPLCFEWNGYELPALRPSVWDRYPRVESPSPESDSDTEMAEMDQDYCLVPETGARASDLADENEALRCWVAELHASTAPALRNRAPVRIWWGCALLHQIRVLQAFPGILATYWTCCDSQDGTQNQRQDGSNQQPHSLSPNNGRSNW